MLDPEKDTVTVLHNEFKKLNQGHMWGGKGMLQLIRQKKIEDQKDPKDHRENMMFYSKSNSSRKGKSVYEQQLHGGMPHDGSGNYLLFSSEDGLHAHGYESPDERGEGESSQHKHANQVSDTGSIMESHEDSDTILSLTGHRHRLEAVNEMMGSESLSC